MIIVDRNDGRVKVEVHGEDYELITEAAMAAVKVARIAAIGNKGCTVRDMLEVIVTSALGIDAALCTTKRTGVAPSGKT